MKYSNLIYDDLIGGKELPFGTAGNLSIGYYLTSSTKWSINEELRMKTFRVFFAIDENTIGQEIWVAEDQEDVLIRAHDAGIQLIDIRNDKVVFSDRGLRKFKEYFGGGEDE